MSTVAVPKERASVVDTGAELEVSIPSPRQVFGTIFLLAWLVGWTLAELAVGRELLAWKAGPANWFMLFWFAIWTVGGAMAVLTLLWLATGRERVTLTSTVLKMKREVLGGLGREREFELAHVRALRVAPARAGLFGQSRRADLFGAKNGIIAFDYGAKTFRFAAGIEEAEARSLVRRFATRDPRIAAEHGA